jgi:hypothetical protein
MMASGLSQIGIKHITTFALSPNVVHAVDDSLLATADCDHFGTLYIYFFAANAALILFRHPT